MLGSFSHANTMGLDGKIVLVTGAGRGVGKALALGFAKAGAHVVAFPAHRRKSKLQLAKRKRWEVRRWQSEPMSRSRMMFSEWQN